MDATRCISYLTIESKSAIPESQRRAIGNHLYGCDICQDVCPWNLAPTPTEDRAWQPQAGRSQVNAADLWQRRDFDLHALVAGSAMTRTSIARLRRNLAVVLGNSKDPRAHDVLDRAGGGVPRAAPSVNTAIVQDHVAWARAALADETRSFCE
jgi:epoxyqueuosine reductase